jgi:hypothetical protein
MTNDPELQVPVPSSAANEAIVRSTDVLFQDLDGETILLHLEAERYYGLDDVGSRIWQLIVEHGNLEAVVTAMLAEFDVEEPVLRADLAEFIAKLRAARLLSEPANGSSL